MRNRTLADLDRVVALGGGHGLGRVLSSLSSLGSRLTGIVTTTRHCLGRYAQLPQPADNGTERRLRDV